MKIKIFNGPLVEFENILPKNKNVNTLTNVVYKMDLLQKGSEIELDVFDTLIIYSDEYTGVKEHFIEGFINYISLYSSYLQFEKVYLHNPPKKIVEQLLNEKLYVDVEIINYNYKDLSIQALKTIKEKFDSIVFGQETAKSELLRSIYTLTNGQRNKPKVLMLYGPPGVGKTETANLINEVIYGTRLFRKQLSMFHNDNIYSYIFGDKVYSLAKDLIDRQSNVLLLDEFDKAHPLFYNAFYQMFDEGVFEDKYYKVELTNTIILCTSNYQTEEEMKERIGAALFSRFDNFIPYKQLDGEAKRKILEKAYVNELKKFRQEEQDFLEQQEILDKMIKVIDQFENAREIQKALLNVLAYPLVERL